MKLCLFSVLLALAGPAFSQTLPRGVERKASLGGITEYAYPNGLRVLLFPDPSSPKVTVNMTYLVGSRFEGYGETGMAHLLEHMNFIRSTHDRDIKKELTDHGAQWNGTTDYDRTNYFETVTASDDNLRWALGLEAERMVNMRMEKALLDTEMTVVRNEFERGENSAQNVLEERVIATAYLWHNYGKSVIGSRADIERVPIDRLAAFYRKYYQPDNAVLVIAGQFDAVESARRWWPTPSAAIPRPTRTLDATYTVEPAQDGERFVELRRVGSTPVVMAAWHGAGAGPSRLGRARSPHGHHGRWRRTRRRSGHRAPLQGAGRQQEGAHRADELSGTARSGIRHRDGHAQQRPVARRGAPRR